MHCWKIINVDRDYGATRIIILSTIVGFLTYCFSYTLLSLNRNLSFNDEGIILFILGLILIYPLHKFIHYILLIDYSKFITLKFRKRFKIVPLVHLKLTILVSKYRYLVSLLGPFILLNGLLIFLTYVYPTLTHYFTIYIGIHSAMCLIDLLNVKHIISAPHKSYIEETPKGYEVLVPLQ